LVVNFHWLELPESKFTVNPWVKVSPSTDKPGLQPSKNIRLMAAHSFHRSYGRSGQRQSDWVNLVDAGLPGDLPKRRHFYVHSLITTRASGGPAIINSTLTTAWPLIELAMGVGLVFSSARFALRHFGSSSFPGRLSYFRVMETDNYRFLD
jgi:hypothetical protein